MRINVLFRSDDSRVKVYFKEDNNRLKVHFKDLYKVNEITGDMIYTGPYSVDPSQEKQYLFTKDKYLKKDITINEVLMGLATTSQIDRLF